MGLSHTATTGRTAPVYAQMNWAWSAALGATSIAFQMNGPDNSTYCSSIDVAVAHHAQSVELWPASGRQPGFTSVAHATLVAWDTALRRGSTLTC